MVFPPESFALIKQIKDKDKTFVRFAKLPFKAFEAETYPYQLKLPNGEIRTVFDRALCLKRDWGEKLWIEKTRRLTKEERKDCQVVIIPPKNERQSNGDFTSGLLKDQEMLNIGKYPAAVFNRTRYENIEYGKRIVNQRKVKSVYIVSSAVTQDDISDILAVANEYKNEGAIEINLIAPFIKDEREDKNVDKAKNNKEGKYNGKIIKIKNIMEELSQSIDRIVTFEPHSGATQSFAALNDIALAPISLEEEMMGQIKDRVIKEKKKWVVVRPDEGRNLVATRIEQLFGIPGVHLEKLRDSISRESETNDLTTKEKKALRGKNTILYDDEGGTLGTIKDIVLKKFIPSEVASINIFLAHARLQKKWRKNLDIIINAAKRKNIPINIYFSDTRRPLGNLKRALTRYKEIIKVISVKDKVKKVIKACINAVNFWVNNGQEGVNWERAILQSIPYFDDKEARQRYLRLLKTSKFTF